MIANATPELVPEVLAEYGAIVSEAVGNSIPTGSPTMHLHSDRTRTWCAA